MALSMSIANLNRSVRVQFDERIDRIQRRMQAEYRNRSYQHDNEDGQSADVTNQTSNHAESRNEITTTTHHPNAESEPSERQNETTQRIHPQSSTDNESSMRQSETTESIRSQPNTDNESNENRTVTDHNANHTIVEESPDTSNQPRPRTRSVDITVDYEELAIDPGPSPEEDRSETAETIDQEINSLSEDSDRRLNCCEFYRKHWVGNLLTGLFSGFLFILLGVIFLVNGDDFPFYAGIMLIVLGLAPCCMALNRYRYARLYERERRRALQRLNALRRAHRHNLREARSRRQAYSDLPPSYDNLGFALDEDDIEMDNFSVTTAGGSFVLPTYDQFMKKSKENQDKTSAKIKTSGSVKDGEHRHDEEHVPPPNYSESVSIADGPSTRSDPQEFVRIAMPFDSIQIIETQYPDNQSRNSENASSIAPTPDIQNDNEHDTIVCTVTPIHVHVHTESEQGESDETNSPNALTIDTDEESGNM